MAYDPTYAKARAAAEKKYGKIHEREPEPIIYLNKPPTMTEKEFKEQKKKEKKKRKEKKIKAETKPTPKPEVKPLIRLNAQAGTPAPSVPMGPTPEEIYQADLAREQEENRLEEENRFRSIKEQINTKEFALAISGTALGVAALGGIVLAGGAAAMGTTAVITRVGTRYLPAAGKKVTLTAQRAFTGTGGKTIIDSLFKAFPKTASVAARFGVNAKTTGMTASMLVKKGLQAATITFIAGAFGSYPFAAWAQEEVLAGLKINARDAREAGDFEMAERMIRMREEVAANPWWRNLPYKNVIDKFIEFFKADKLAIESEKRLIAEARGEMEFEGKSLGRQIEERDIAQTEKFAEIAKEREARDVEFKESEEARIKRQKERDVEFAESEEERRERQEERDKEFREAQEERDIADRQDAAYFEVLRQLKTISIEEIDPEIVALARKSNLFLGQF